LSFDEKDLYKMATKFHVSFPANCHVNCQLTCIGRNKLDWYFPLTSRVTYTHVHSICTMLLHTQLTVYSCSWSIRIPHGPCAHACKYAGRDVDITQRRLYMQASSHLHLTICIFNLVFQWYLLHLGLNWGWGKRYPKRFSTKLSNGLSNQRD